MQVEILLDKFEEFLNHASSEGFQIVWSEDAFTSKALILNPKCVNMLIDLLHNEQAYKIVKLVKIVVNLLARVTMSIYKQQKGSEQQKAKD